MNYGDIITLNGIEYTIVEIKNSVALLKNPAGKLVLKWIGAFFKGGA